VGGGGGTGRLARHAARPSPLIESVVIGSLSVIRDHCLVRGEHPRPAAANESWNVKTWHA
jgi:hypothetical protein